MSSTGYKILFFISILSKQLKHKTYSYFPDYMDTETPQGSEVLTCLA